MYLKVSPDGVHILDKHPKYPNIVVGCGFSGNIFWMWNRVKYHKYTQDPIIKNGHIRHSDEISGNFKKLASKGSNLKNALK